MTNKANTAAHDGYEGLAMPPGATDPDGQPFNPQQGGMVKVDGNWWASVADRDIVPDGYDEPDVGDVLKRRITPVNMPLLRKGENRKRGLEVEFKVVDEEGGYKDVIGNDGKYVPWLSGYNLAPELNKSMAETSFPACDTPQEAFQTMSERLAALGQAALNNKALVAPVSVFAQNEGESVNPHRYVQFITSNMEKRTGMSVDGFQVAGIQFHQEIDAATAVPLLKAMQPIMPFLAASSLSGPFLWKDSLREIVEDAVIDPEKAEAHLQKVGITEQDLSRRAMYSWRHILRRIFSPASGTIGELPPDNLDEFFNLAHKRLANGELATPDRLQGDHTDRLRWGIGTYEMCSFDTFAGNPLKIWAAQQFSCAVVRGIEKMLAESNGDMSVLANKLPEFYPYDPNSLESLTYSEEINKKIAHRGMDAEVGGKKVYQYFEKLAAIVDYSGQLDEHSARIVTEEMRKSYVSESETQKNIFMWAEQENKKYADMQAYFDTGIGVPASYMNSLARSLMVHEGALSHQKLVRKCELNLAQVATISWAKQGTLA